MNDELYDRLRAADPMPRSAPVESADTSHTRSLMEAAMSTAPTNDVRRQRWIPVAIGGAAAAIVGGVLLLGPAFGEDPAPAAAPLQLSLPGADGTSMTSCIQFSVDQLAQMPVAFAGTVLDVDDTAVTLQVDTWYAGGDASSVEIVAPDGPSTALLGGEIEFGDGRQYLITATAGNVNLCGFSGAATPELQAAFEQAFSG